MKPTDLDLMKTLLSLPEPERADLLVFLGAEQKTSMEIEKLVCSLTNSIAIRQDRLGQKPI